MEALLSQGQSTVIIGITGDLEADALAQALASNLSSVREPEEVQPTGSDASDCSGPSPGGPVGHSSYLETCRGC